MHGPQFPSSVSRPGASLTLFGMQTERTERKKTPTVWRRLAENQFVELIYSSSSGRTGLAHYDGAHCRLVDELSLDSGECLIPISASNNLIRHGAILLPEKAEEYESMSELTARIDGYLHRYIDLSTPFRKLATFYILMSWVHDAFNELPYIRLRGDLGSGKTRALTIIGSLCYRPFFASGASTVSPIFHTLDSFGGTLILDEADFRFSDEKSELVKILNNGNMRGFPVLRTAITIKREFDPRAFNVFGPKMVAMRHSFEDPALESRFLTEEMGQRRMRRDIPINLPDEQKEEATALRNQLLMYRFRTLANSGVNSRLVDDALSPRLNQILVPLLSVIEDEELRTEIVEMARDMEEENISTRSTSTEAELLEVLSSLLATDDRLGIPVGEIAAAFAARFGTEYERPITSRYIGGLLRKRFHLPTHKSNGVYVVPSGVKDRVDVLCEKYGVGNQPTT